MGIYGPANVRFSAPETEGKEGKSLGIFNVHRCNYVGGVLGSWFDVWITSFSDVRPFLGRFAGVFLVRVLRRSVRVLFLPPGRPVSLGPLSTPRGRHRIGQPRLARALAGARLILLLIGRLRLILLHTGSVRLRYEDPKNRGPNVRLGIRHQIEVVRIRRPSMSLLLDHLAATIVIRDGYRRAARYRNFDDMGNVVNLGRKSAEFGSCAR